MAELTGDVLTPSTLTDTDRDRMFAIMEQVYDNTDRAQFEADLAAKDEVIVLRDPNGCLGGFSTQRFLDLDIGGRVVRGVFSGDTVIAPEHWGGMVLFQTFARRYIITRNEPWYWFLICKGQRTYRLLPTFFTDYWPSRHAPTPGEAARIMDAYAGALYPDDYDPATGVLAYRHPKDRLRPGIAGVDEMSVRNPDAAFFAARNPGHELGHDLVCLTVLDPANLRPQHRARLLGHP
ncbi:hypothetical protein [Enemella sp. A6]|uniref:hypothetical protein n=1 Tax=Enemella sp. A6 TaxID=3440152 RepID=UPI003EC07FDF